MGERHGRTRKKEGTVKTKWHLFTIINEDGDAEGWYVATSRRHALELYGADTKSRRRTDYAHRISPKGCAFTSRPAMQAWADGYATAADRFAP